MTDYLEEALAPLRRERERLLNEAIKLDQLIDSMTALREKQPTDKPLPLVPLANAAGRTVRGDYDPQAWKKPATRKYRLGRPPMKGVADKVLEAVKSAPEKDFTNEDVYRYVHSKYGISLHMASISSTLAQFSREGKLFRPGRGVYRWHPPRDEKVEQNGLKPGNPVKVSPAT